MEPGVEYQGRIRMPREEQSVRIVGKEGEKCREPSYVERGRAKRSHYRVLRFDDLTIYCL